MKKNKNKKKPQESKGCKTNCIYFPTISSSVHYILDENGVKKREKTFQYVCGYDNHIIKNWSNQCPRYLVGKEPVLLNKEKEK